MVLFDDFQQNKKVIFYEVEKKLSPLYLHCICQVIVDGQKEDDLIFNL